MLAHLLDRIQNKARLMGAVLERLRIDPVDAARIRGGSAVAAAWRKCLACRHAKECATWLEPPASISPQAPRFCPNVAFFTESSVRPASWPAPSLLPVVDDNTSSAERRRGHRSRSPGSSAGSALAGSRSG